ncbi:CaiB/BaiF CoA transferase family protein [Bacillus solimangrovi]|uniref:Alpha-methylacyl-CoA racemase n=1 Tax=Bacillus solimangrovi TaxID=1305675 RepID=A0A1E5LFT3_9BACI|nr:CaiB/BaiF CoA-transferase family protein [Bacillus solimangrovi]OEH92931.1 alpha-methylacyl-CoA racemase [Bacillus solimangrovi]
MLKGLRVLDFSHYIPGPYATMRLADLGAEVVKVEPLTGDLARNASGIKEESGIVFDANNRNKKSITVNLKTNEGVHRIKELVKEADVVVESFRPGVMTKLGVGYEQAKKINPTLIYCSLSGYGQEGSLAHLGSHDLNYMALSGLLSQMKDKEGRPIHPTLTFADLVGGLAASEGILAALVRREREEKGAYVDAALLDSVIGFMNIHELLVKRTGKKTGMSLLDGTVVCYGIYETKDARYVSLAALEPKFWNNFCEAVDRIEWKGYQFTKAIDDEEFYENMKKLFMEKTMEEWAKLGKRYDCCLTPVLEPGELNSFSYCTERMLIHNVNPQLLYVATRLETNLKEANIPPTLGMNNEMVFSNQI